VKAAKTRALNAKHAGTRKHAGTAKHTPAATKKAATAKKAGATRTALSPKAARARALGDCASCCAEAVVTSLRLSGRAVAPEDVLTLYRYTADGLIAGATIQATLEAAAAHGVAGARPVSFAPVALDDPAAVILGLDLPEGPHAVTLGKSGDVWSWGSLYEMTDEAVIEEAWSVIWP
jgi:hypothetical protein